MRTDPRIDIYSILVKNGYKLPYKYPMLVDVMVKRRDIAQFLRNEVDHEQFKNVFGESGLTWKLASYDDEQWEKLIWRLVKNGHYNKEMVR